MSDLIDNKEPIITKVIQEAIDRVNAKAISNAQRVQKWTLLSKDFSISGGELGKDFYYLYMLRFMLYVFDRPEICKTKRLKKGIILIVHKNNCSTEIISV